MLYLDPIFCFLQKSIESYFLFLFETKRKKKKDLYTCDKIKYKKKTLFKIRSPCYVNFRPENKGKNELILAGESISLATSDK